MINVVAAALDRRGDGDHNRVARDDGQTVGPIDLHAGDARYRAYEAP